jgi:hypothetical protein
MLENGTDTRGLDALATRPAVEEFAVSGAGSFDVVPGQPDDTKYVKERYLSGAESYAAPAGSGIPGVAAIRVTPTSITLRFTPHDAGAAEKLRSRYGAATRIRSADGRWDAVRVSRTGPSRTPGTELFDCAMLVRREGDPALTTTTRLILAGAAWTADVSVDGAPIVVRPLSDDVASHHDKRMAIVAVGALGDVAIEDAARAAGFVSGVELAILRVERYDRAGNVVESEDRRWAPRVGWLPHAPFTGVSAQARAQAFAALATALARDDGRGFPLRHVVEQINASYTIRNIHLSAHHLAQALMTAAFHAAHGRTFDDSSQATTGVERLNERLELGLGPAERARIERLRVELLEAGFFHDPGYESGRPQRDIKFLRDVVDAIVLRSCGYTGPYHGSEHATVLEMSPSTVTPGV